MEALRVNARLSLPADELNVTFARSGGPGGQNVNRVASKVVLRFSIARSPSLGDVRRARLLDRLASRVTREGEVVIHASRYREQARNLEDARERLAQLLRDALAVPRSRRQTRPTRASQRRRVDEKRLRGRRKQERKRGPDD